MSSTSGFYPEPLSATTKSSSSQSPPDANAGSSSKHRKTRREKPRIELASDQPLTTQGKLRSRVYVACMQWRINDDYDESSEDVINITSEPSLDFTRKTWWDSLLVIYASSSPVHVPALTLSERNQASNLITRDLRFLFQKRDQMQPSLVIAALAIATFFQSSEAGLGEEGRKKALRLRDIAQGSLEASLNGRWIDETLAQAAWLLAMFEVCAHPLHSTERSASSMVMLDTIIRSLSLTFLDANDPHASKFAPRTVPTVPVAHSNTSWSPSDVPPAYPIPRTYYPSSGVNYNYSSTQVSTSSTKVDKGCSCASLSLGQRWSGASEHTPLWLSTPAWDENWTDGEIRKESCRRLCWSALMLTAGHSSYTNSCNRLGPELFLVEPANYVLLFPGEALTRSQALTSNQSPKDTVWALYYRTMLLWHSCLGIRLDPNATEEEKARFGVNAWLEADALDKALDSHTCGLERAFLFQGREYLFNVRMCISYEFQRYIPLATANANGLFHRTKAEEWLSHQANVAQRVVHAMHTVTGQASNTVVHRPFFAFWFMSQISRALSLWECDNSLTIALEVCMAFLKPIDYLSTLWPCEEQRSRCRKLREQLTRACSIAGRPPPPPPPSFEYSPTSVP
ncbi:hypothetical protein SERLA73DRAFT_123675 [Serpula lacrymans var. lacrymans S7.3]|uniref:Transcription factor domain-containing protein n=1 Tax=Serpula lacrymans var. lacrymans (strain S7.3) TaxID=936435 RepID=F8PZN5_SERL3|nr:hypothetical protein SERLA73DRAFT_123675 [Serpula lacrymans var. lacrymans S7.3]